MENSFFNNSIICNNSQAECLFVSRYFRKLRFHFMMKVAKQHFYVEIYRIFYKKEIILWLK
ncbi:hypothetical protein LEP1GSC020_0050 [Leptospira interrogans serovar Grippotyphosa str. 2006006986]|uniref:Uncharacterized protein n=1 Tax=Leptospira interrogans str. 2002000626 TaxID=996803 RepID=A0A829D8X7_LEPIR|nr:hypothetical protein LEP1GSC080_1350 [Leptospira interrogans str. FPW2026]EKO88706.1 hypothetical protein LEP1GSC009_0489 [Leptospira interrogans serovar Grippotyphosa str. Andaman]EKP84007.1 hypothetical protein LEP1GSC020_0050 [Leptospira interrogans serovar Grippotyphosa str. 2006006986]EMF73998.1 hypothetical protein LEP1GSC148_0372 [Leptospira interrogans serovar Canicola str. LT1962]EMN82819.1 hypothetical protein LEP1GSC106_1492 [Leptospira interrogans serovar Grippotyphosa str. UI 12